MEPRARVAERLDKTINAEMRDDVDETPDHVVIALNCLGDRDATDGRIERWGRH